MTSNNGNVGEEYLTKVLQKYSFAEVIEEERRLSNEIKNIDLQMQKMVYENYSNFIETNKLLSDMHPELISIKDTLEQVKNTLSTSKEQSDRIKDMILEEQPEIVAIIKKQHMMEKIDRVSKLPSKMKESMKNQNYMDVIKLYREEMEFFDRWGEYSQVDNVKQKCVKIINESEDSLFQIIRNIDVHSQVSIYTALDSLFVYLSDNHPLIEQKILSIVIGKIDEAFYNSSDDSFLGINEEFITLTLPKVLKTLESIESKILIHKNCKRFSKSIIESVQESIENHITDLFSSMLDSLKKNRFN